MTSPRAITNIYYTYIAVLPLLAFLSIYWVPENWNVVLQYIDSGGESDGVYLYNVFCFIAIFISGLLGVLFVRLIPIPKSAIAGLFMLFDAPVEFWVAHLLGSDITWSEIIFIDFFVETLGLALAICFLMLGQGLGTKEKSPDIQAMLTLVLIYCVAVLFSYYGVFAWERINNQSGWKKLPYFISILTTTAMYGKVFFAKAEIRNDVDQSGQATVLSGVCMMLIWAILFYAYGVLLFNAVE